MRMMRMRMRMGRSMGRKLSNQPEFPRTVNLHQEPWEFDMHNAQCEHSFHFKIHGQCLAMINSGGSPSCVSIFCDYAINMNRDRRKPVPQSSSTPIGATCAWICQPIQLHQRAVLFYCCIRCLFGVCFEKPLRFQNPRLAMLGRPL